MTTHFLRNDNNETVVDIDCSSDDLSSIVCIDKYTEYLFNDIIPEEQFMFAEDMNAVQEIRGIYFEDPAWTGTPDQLAREWCKKMADKWGFHYVVD